MKDVERGGFELPAIQCRDHRAVIDQGAACDVDQDGALLDVGEEGLAGETARGVIQWARQHDDIGIGEEALEVVHRAGGVDNLRRLRRATDDVDGGAKRFGAGGRGGADRTKSDD